MITLLWYLVVAALIAGVVFAVTLVVFGRGEQLSPLPPRTSPSELPPAGSVEGSHVKALRLGVAVRGYRMSDVDWTLDRLQEELDLVRTEQDRLRALVTELGGDPTPPVPTAVVTDEQESSPTDSSETEPVDTPDADHLGSSDPENRSGSEASTAGPVAEIGTERRD